MVCPPPPIHFLKYFCLFFFFFSLLVSFYFWVTAVCAGFRREARDFLLDIWNFCLLFFMNSVSIFSPPWPTCARQWKSFPSCYADSAPLPTTWKQNKILRFSALSGAKLLCPILMILLLSLWLLLRLILFLISHWSFTDTHVMVPKRRWLLERWKEIVTSISWSICDVSWLPTDFLEPRVCVRKCVNVCV